MLWTLTLIGYLLTWSAIPHVLLANKRPAATLAWIWSILLFPFVGALFYLLVGADQIKRKRLKRVSKAKFLRHGESQGAARLISALPPAETALLRALTTINEIPPATAGSVQVLANASAFYPALKKRIAEARHHVHIEFFIWRDDEHGRAFLQLLVAAAQRGVQVRLLLDQIGCLGTARSYFDPLIAAGGQFAWFYSLPFGRHSRFLNLRNHRKLQIIDGAWAFVGGMNVGREYHGEDPNFGPWRDTQLEVSGNVLIPLQETFATDWYFATEQRISAPEYFPATQGEDGPLCQVISGGPDSPREPIPNSLIALLNFAKKRVWIATGYFAPDAPLLSALQICAARGVEVQLLVSEKTDHPYLVLVGRSYYHDLMRYGIRVFEYSKAVNHSKAILVDDEWLMVGSANSDNRSMRLNFELNLLIHSQPQAQILKAMLAADFRDSRAIAPGDFLRRSFGKRLLEAVLRPLAPLL